MMSPRPDAQLHFGVFFQGVNYWTIWSTPASGSQISPESYRQVAQTAERGLFDAFFLGEGLRLREVGGRVHELDVAGRPDAITQLAALAAVTDHAREIAMPFRAHPIGHHDEHPVALHGGDHAHGVAGVAAGSPRRSCRLGQEAPLALGPLDHVLGDARLDRARGD